MTNEQRLSRAASEAEAAFWSVIAAAYPEAATGDLDPGTAMRATHEMRAAAQAWVAANAPTASPSN